MLWRLCASSSRVLVRCSACDESVPGLARSFHSACGAGILRLATFARRMAPGNLRLPVEEVDALISGLEAMSPSTLFTPPTDQ